MPELVATNLILLFLAIVGWAGFGTLAWSLGKLVRSEHESRRFFCRELGLRDWRELVEPEANTADTTTLTE